jgi:plasmid stabilization system protein ParE
MRSIISDQAKQQIRLIAKYIRKEFGKKRRDEFIQEVRQTRRLIEQSPNIGPVEPLLEELPAMYRSYVMNGLNKMVYRIEDDTIYIVDFWDVRQDPSTLAERNI